MRWSTLVLPVTLFYSLSFVYAIPHDVDEMRHWMHKRQDTSGSSALSVSGSAVSRDPQGQSSSQVVSSTAAPNSLTQSPGPSSTLPSSVSSLSSTGQPASDGSLSTSSSSSSTSTSLSSSPTNNPSQTSLTSSSTITNGPNGHDSTSYRRFSSTIGIPSDTQSAGGNSGTGSGSTAFLKNKAAMGSIFAIVGLVGAAIIVGAVFFLIKKIRQRKDEEDFETYFEKSPAHHGNNSSSRDFGGNDYGLGPSATELAAPANSQTYMPRDVHYGATGQYPSQSANYNGLEFPPERGSVIEPSASYVPGTAYAAAMSQRGQYRYEGQVEDPNTVPNHPFADPDHRRY